MITTGAQLNTLITSLNAGSTIDADFLDVLVGVAQAILEEERSWVVLRKTNSSKTVTTGNTWQTAIDLSTITDFSRFYSDKPIQLFNGDNRVEYYDLKPFDRRLFYKNTSYTACFDENTKTLYLNGTVPFNGTLYISYMSTSTAIDLTSTSAVWTLFPNRFLPVIAFYAVGINKGAVDYDTINKQMLPMNQAVLLALKNAMEKWDNEKQGDSLSNNDPTDGYSSFPRSGAIDRSNTI